MKTIWCWLIVACLTGCQSTEICLLKEDQLQAIYETVLIYYYHDTGYIDDSMCVSLHSLDPGEHFRNRMRSLGIPVFPGSENKTRGLQYFNIYDVSQEARNEVIVTVFSGFGEVEIDGHPVALFTNLFYLKMTISGWKVYKFYSF